MEIPLGTQSPGGNEVTPECMGSYSISRLILSFPPTPIVILISQEMRKIITVKDHYEIQCFIVVCTHGNCSGFPLDLD